MGYEIRRQWLQLWRSCRWMFILFFVTLLLDAVSTIHFMRSAGAEAELHPAVRIVSVLFGTVAGPLLSAVCKAVAACVVLLYLKAYAPLVLLSASAFFIFAFFYNLFAVDLYLSGWIPWLPF